MLQYIYYRVMLGLNVFIGIRRDIKGSFVDALFILVIGFRDLVS